MKDIRKLIITGGTGYIGSQLAEYAAQHGFDVTVLSRSKRKSKNNIKYVNWSLGDGLPLEALNDETEQIAVIHLAHDWKNLICAEFDNQSLNSFASKKLLDSCRLHGITRFVFISSQSARQDAPNIYGRVKWDIEQAINGEDTVSARVGLVYGGVKKGMYGLLLKLVKLPVIPMLTPGQLVQPIHINELCSGILKLAQNKMTGWVGLADPKPLTFGCFLKTLAKLQYSHKLYILPIPLSLALFGCRVTQYIPLIPTIDKERVLGLSGTKVIESGKALGEMGLSIIPLSQININKYLYRRGVLVEGYALLRYILGKKPSYSLLKYYLRAIHLSGDFTKPYGLPLLAIQFPWLIRFIEPLNKKYLLARRLALAASLVDVSLDGAKKYLFNSPSRRLYNILLLPITLLMEMFLLPFRLVMARNTKNDRC